MTSFHLERQFGRTVGSVFAIIGIWMLWRARVPAAVGWSFTGLGSLLLALSLIHPSALTYPRRAWMALAEALAFVSTRVILGLVFFLGVTPIGTIMRAFGWDPLTRRRKAAGESYWQPYPARQRDPTHVEKMF